MGFGPIQSSGRIQPAMRGAVRMTTGWDPAPCRRPDRAVVYPKRGAREAPGFPASDGAGKAVLEPGNVMKAAVIEVAMRGEIEGGESVTGTAGMRCGVGKPPWRDWMGLRLDWERTGKSTAGHPCRRLWHCRQKRKGAAPPASRRGTKPNDCQPGRAVVSPGREDHPEMR